MQSHDERGSLVVKKAVVLLSGGLDSATTLAIAKSEGYACYALSFRYGQRHKHELDAAQRVAASLGVQEHRTLDIDLGQIGGSALTDSTIDVPKNRAEDEMQEIPATYVPARNTIFLSYALAWADNDRSGQKFRKRVELDGATVMDALIDDDGSSGEEVFEASAGSVLSVAFVEEASVGNAAYYAQFRLLAEGGGCPEGPLVDWEYRPSVDDGLSELYRCLAALFTDAEEAADLCSGSETAY